MIRTIGSLCSGIESGTVAWRDMGFEYEWYSEIAPFPNRILEMKYPNVSNLGDMINIPQMILEKSVTAPDLISVFPPKYLSESDVLFHTSVPASIVVSPVKFSLFPDNLTVPSPVFTKLPVIRPISTN